MDSLAPEGELSRDLLSDQVYRRIRQMIVQNQLEPGERLVESELARRYGTSQAPVRDAIKKLAHEGLVTHVSRRGNYVTQVSEETAAQARRARAVIEQLAAREAAGKLDDRQRKTLEAAIAAIREAAEQGDAVAVRNADAAFHRLVCEASGNEFLPKMWRLLEPSLYELRAISEPLQGVELRDLVGRHQQLLDVLLAGDADKAAEIFGNHASGKHRGVDVL